MTAVRRWLETGSEATALEREILGASSHFDPPEGAEAAVWAALVGLLPPPGGGGAPAPGGGSTALPGGSLPPPAVVGASAGAKLAVTKTVLTTLVVGAAGFGTLLAIDRQPARPVAAESAPRSADVPSAWPAPSVEVVLGSASIELPALPARAEPPVAPPEPSSTSTMAAFPTPGAAPSAAFSDLREEHRLLRSAREALRTGNSAAALEQIEAARSAFPQGELEQEREVLAIRALIAAGRKSEARDRASAFLRSHPTSPLSGRVASLLREAQ